MNKKNITAITTLSPAQEGMLYETIRASEPGIHIEQSMDTLTGTLDVAAFERAWQWAIDRHAILRTSFVWKEQAEPLQVTQRQVALPLTYQDWRGFSLEEQQARAEAALQQARARGFELSRPPLMRLLLVRLDEQTYHFLWTFHHILLDGWSKQVLLGEILSCYRALVSGKPVSRETSRPYSDYIAWLKQQEVAQAERFWRGMLGGFTQPTALGREQESAATYDPQERYGSALVQLSEEVSAALGQVAQHHRVTLSTIVQGVWAMLLRHYSGNDDVVFGVTVSGRPAELAGVETMVGPFFNTLPLRVQVPTEASLWSWLQELQRLTVEMHAYEYSSSGQVHQWSEMAGQSLLYESILVVENYPISATKDGLDEMEVEVVARVTKGAQTKYALTFLVVGGSQVGIQCVYDTARFESVAIDQIIAHFHRLLSIVAADLDIQLERLYSWLPENEIPIVYPARRIVPMEEGRSEYGPRSPMEEVIAGVWCEVLGVAHVGRESHFFALGGHSLLATQLLARVRAILGIEVPLRAVFEEPTVAGFSLRVEHLLRQGEALPLPPLVAQSRPEAIPLSYAQQRLWFLEQLEPGSTVYLLPSALNIGGKVEFQHLKRTMQELISRHESLRTTFEERAGQPVQVIHPAHSYTLPMIDLQRLGRQQRDQEAQRLANQEAHHPCDLVQGPLVRVHLLRLERAEHVLLLTQHHIITDGWSNKVFVHELVTLYRSFEAGQPSPLEPLPLHYADYALWQRGWLHGEALEAQLTYWRAHLAAVPVLEMPTDHPRPAMQSSRGAMQTLHIPAAVSEGLVALSQQEHVTLFMLLLAALQVLLQRYSGQDDVSVGTPIANRRHAEIEGVIGLFVNTLVLRTDLSGNPTFTQVLQRVREVCLGAYAHQDVPFEQVVEALAPKRDLSHSPLFQVMLALQNTPQEQDDLRGVSIEQLDVTYVISRFDLAFSLNETGSGLACLLEYTTDLFEAETITRLLGHWQTLLEGIVHHPQAHLWELPLLTRGEHDLLLEHWNATQVDFPGEMSLHQLFEEQVQRTPEAVALVLEEQTLTYADLNGRANYLAHHLQCLGVGPEVLVGICMQRSIEMIIGVLAVFKAGGASLPLDPTYPADRLAFLLEDTHVGLLLVHPPSRKRVPEFNGTIFCLETDWSSIAHYPQHNPESGALPDHLAYVIYTSGSTGKPKGVMVSQRAIGNRLRWGLRATQLGTSDRSLQIASLSFDIALWEIFGPLLSGACLVLAQPDGYRDSTYLLALLEREQITVAHFVPSLFQVLLHAPELAQCQSLRCVLYGGEASSADLPQHFFAQSSARLQQFYGPTEAAINATFWSGDPQTPERRATIGRPIENMQVYLLDAQEQPVPIGVTGELYLGGVGLARGYWQRPDLSAERFVPDVWSGEVGRRVYRTGDLARYRSNGELEFVGRSDTQVKIRGCRIEPGEIETVLMEHPSVRQAVVVGQENHLKEKSLVAYLTFQSDPTRVPAEGSSSEEKRMGISFVGNHGSEQEQDIELWPSIGEYYVYDELIYYGLTNDEPRNKLYKAALEQVVAGKIVVDIGTGKDAILARLCLEAGAKHVYAIELMDETYRQALICINQLGLSDQITLIHGDATQVQLPELAEVCVTETFEAIAGAEGAAVILNTSRHLLTATATTVPERSLTKIAAASLPTHLLDCPAFTSVAGYYVQKIFEQVGYPFDLRVCLKNFPSSRLASTHAIFEDLDCTGNAEVEYSRQVQLVVTQNTRIDGFLLWLVLELAPGQTLDILDGHYSWFPVYFPVFQPGVEVTVGDVIEMTCQGLLSENGVHPDYALEGRIRKQNGESIPFSYLSPHHQGLYKKTPFYQQLFASETIPVQDKQKTKQLRAEVRHYLEQRLPSSLLPSQLVVLDTLPLTPNGKVDRKALPTPNWERAQADIAFIAPRTAIERTLAIIWEEVLQTKAIGVQDNFFERGGDSIISIQIIARARQQGLRFTLKQLFQYQTIEQLSPVVDAAALVQAEQGLVLGSLPLTPIQHRFFELDPVQPQHWNQALFFEMTERLRSSLLEQVVRAWLSQHDALRLRFFSHDDGWSQSFADLEDPIPCLLVDLSRLHVEDQEEQATRLAGQTQASLDLSEGPLVRVVLFERGRDQAHLLLLVIHHLAVDGVSWRILLEDLSQAYQQRVRGEAIVLPAKTSSFKAWAEHLQAYAHSVEMQQEQAFWLNHDWEQVRALPRDLNGQANTVASVRKVSCALTVEETRVLLEEVPAVYHTQINEVLLTALAQTLGAWMGSRKVLIDLEGHGREDLFVDVDISRTVGWFTSIFPVYLTLGETSRVAQAIQRVKEHLRAIPNHGIGYGILRYLSRDPALAEQLYAQPQAEVSFNYLGQLDQVGASSSETTSLIGGMAHLSAGLAQSGQERRVYLLDIASQVSGNQFQVTWSYGEGIHRRSTIERLASDFMEVLRAIIEQRQTSEVNYSPTDFAQVHLTQEQIEQIQRELALEPRRADAIVAITTLSPAQEGMLYETIRALEPGIHIEQSTRTLMGTLDVVAFEQAWQWAVDRHAILRTGFVWQELDPLQVTLRQVTLPLTYQDWRGFSPEEQQMRAEETLRQERARGFELSRPPLMRLLLARLDEQTYHFLWTSHHILLDGWSQQVLLGEILSCYQALSAGQAVSREVSRPYSDYIAWLKQQDGAQAEWFWRGMLGGFTQPTALGREQEPAATYDPQERYGSTRVRLSEEVSSALGQAAQHYHVTLSTIVQGVWALLLRHYSGNDDVVFGVTVSGRPAELAGVETMVGPFFNTLPLRVQVPSQASLWSWLQEVQRLTVEMHAYEYTSSGQVHQWSEMAGRSLLYESILVVENYPIRATAPGSGEMAVEVEGGTSRGAHTKYALTVLVVGGSSVGIQCVYDTSRFEGAAIDQIVSHFHHVLGIVATDPEVQVETLSRGLPEHEIPIVYPALRAVAEEEGGREQAPRSPLEEVIAGVWSEVLGLTHVGRESHFFALGGHSLLATQLLARVRAILQVEVPLRAIFEEPTVAGFALRVEHLLRQGEALPLPPLVARERQEELPLSYAQQRLWFLDQLEPESTAYLAPMALSVRGEVDASHLERAFEELISRHESLRTTFEERAGQPVQMIRPIRSYTLPVIDLHTLGQEQREQEVQRLVSQEAQRPCDLVQGPLLRTALLRLEKQEHVLLLTLHHIITDGWSNGILVQELTILYHSLGAGQPPPFAPLPIQYADYALWQRGWLQGEILEAHLAYWRRHLAQVPSLEMPTDHSRPAVQTFRGAMQPLRLPVAVSDALVALSQQEHVTLFMTLLAAFQMLLQRYSGQDDVSVGTPIANRRHAEIEGVIGFFVNTLVLRTDLSGNPTFTQVLQRVREVCLGAYAHQDLPFEQVVEALAPTRDLSRPPLFQVMLVLQNTPHEQEQDDLAGIRVESLMVESMVSKFDLTLSLSETENGLAGMLEYNSDLFEAQTITRLLGHWQILLEGIVQNPQTHLSDLPLLTAEEHTLQLEHWNATATPYPQNLCVHQLFEEQVQRTPEVVALVFKDETLTYACLNRRANQLTHHLQTFGVGPEVLVGICMERSIEMVVALLAILKAGGAYVPLDPSYPQDRLTFIVEDAHVALLLTSHLPEALEAVTQSIQSLDLGCERHAIAAQRSENPHGPVCADNLAYVIYTSGSTGKPKGTMVLHRNVSNFFTAMDDRLGAQEAGVWLAVTSISFDISVLELLWTLARGFQVVVRSSLQETSVTHDPDRSQEEAFAAQIQRQGITHLQCTPSQASLLLAEPEFPSALGSLRMWLLGGEALSGALLTQIEQGFEGTIHNMYGPTETTIWSLTHRMQKSDPTVVIGRPIANTQVYLLDPHGHCVPIGVAGELFLGGKGVVRGYLNRADLTAEKFLPDPWSAEAGACLYRTGDLARYLPDGTIEYLGRMDQQVKIRGYRIELGEIETVLREQPGVREAVVQVREDAGGQKWLVAYVVSAEQIAAAALRRGLHEKLPAPMVPARFQRLDALPLTPNGKVDRKRLPAPDEWEGEEGHGQQRSRTPIEEVVQGLWSTVLGRTQIGIYDNFFELGGHSLLATQLLARVRATLGVEIALRTIFEEPTVAGFARRVEHLLRQDEALPLPPLVARERPEEVPLSYAQQRLWFLDQLEPESTVYLVPTALSIRGEVDAYHLERAFEELIVRHENLRTTFASHFGRPMQVIHPVGSYMQPVIDLQPLGQEQREQEAQRLVSQEAQHPYDLVQGPLLRTALLRLGRQEHVLLLTLHHIITDGWSNGMLMQELTTLYRSFKSGQSSPLASLPIQYADYALWQRGWLYGEVLDAHLAYWREHLAGVTPLKLPADVPHGAKPSNRGASYAFRLPSELAEGLMKVSRQEGVTLFMLLLATFQILLYRLSGQEDIVVGTDVANRNHLEIEGLIGFFVNQLVLRSRVVGYQTFRKFLHQVRNMTLDAYLHQDVPFEKLVEALRPERQATPFFTVKMLLRSLSPEGSFSQETNALLDIAVASFTLPAKKAVEVDLTLRFAQTSEGIQGVFDYRTDLFEEATIARMARYFLTLLKSSSTNQDELINGLEMLSMQEKREMKINQKERETALSMKLKSIHPGPVPLRHE